MTEIDQIIDGMLINPLKGLRPNNVKSQHFIAVGQDSMVCKEGNLAYKIYSQTDPIRKIDKKRADFYRQVTNDAERFVSRQGLSITTTNRAYRLTVNQVNQVDVSRKYNAVVSVSPFIEGTNIPNDPEIVNFLSHVSAMLMDQLGLAGINIIPNNVLLCRDLLVVTDICSQLKAIHVHGKRKFR